MSHPIEHPKVIWKCSGAKTLLLLSLPKHIKWCFVKKHCSIETEISLLQDSQIIWARINLGVEEIPELTSSIVVEMRATMSFSLIYQIYIPSPEI